MVGWNLSREVIMENIYWYKIIWIDRTIFRGFKINQVVGFLEKQKDWAILNKECTAIEPYIKFKYLGKTNRTGNKKSDKEEFDKLMVKVK